MATKNLKMVKNIFTNFQLPGGGPGWRGDFCIFAHRLGYFSGEWVTLCTTMTRCVTWVWGMA